jgi:hypothetical protein
MDFLGYPLGWWVGALVFGNLFRRGREETAEIVARPSASFIDDKGTMMYRLQHGLILLGLAAVVVASTGCGGQPTLQTEYVEGVVTLDGQPVEGATVTFVPVAEGQGAPATGMTNAQGV